MRGARLTPKQDLRASVERGDVEAFLSSPGSPRDAVVAISSKRSWPWAPVRCWVSTAVSDGR